MPNKKASAVMVEAFFLNSVAVKMIEIYSPHKPKM
jgi:hypothetical protein